MRGIYRDFVICDDILERNWVIKGDTFTDIPVDKCMLSKLMIEHVHASFSNSSCVGHNAHGTLYLTRSPLVGRMGIEFLPGLCLRVYHRLRLLVGKKERVNEKYDKNSESKS